MSALRELLALFEIRVESAELTEAGKKIENFKDKLLEAGKVFLEAFAVNAVREFVDRQVEAVTELERTAAMLGLTTEAVERYRLAAGEAGIQQEEMTTGLRFLARNMGEALSGSKEIATTFASMHIALKNADGTTRSTSDVFEDLADHIAATEESSKRADVAVRLLGRSGMMLLPMLEKGGKAFRDANRDLKELGGPTTKETIEGAKKIEEAEFKLSFAFDKVKLALATALFPLFESFVNRAIAVAKSIIELTTHTTALKSGLLVLEVVLGIKVLGTLKKILSILGLLRPSIGETAGALTRLGAKAALITALYLAFDDLYAFLSGRKSVIGDTIDKIDGLGSGAETSAAMAILAKAAWHDLVAVLEDLGRIVWNLVTGPFRALWDIGKGVASMIEDITKGDFGKLKKDFVDAGKDVGKDLIGRAADAAHDALHIHSELTDPETQKKVLEAGDKAKAKVVRRHQKRWKDFVDHFKSERPEIQMKVSEYAGAHKLNELNDPEMQDKLLAYVRHQQKKYASLPREPTYASLPTAHSAGDGAVDRHERAAPTIQQTNNYKIDVHTEHHRPKAVGDATGGAVATQQQIANANALAALKKK